jgi:N-acetylneuraminic acid mutarotase
MRYLKVYFLGLTVFTLASCTSNSDTTKLGNWIKRADYQGDARREAVSFVIGDTAYVGTGFGGTGDGAKLNDFWKYDPVKDAWTAMASLVDPNDATKDLSRLGATGFAVGTKGYVTTGYNNNYEMLKDTWEFDPASNTWQSRTDFPGTARYYAVSFGLGNYGYVGTGSSGTSGSNFSDFYKFDPSSNSWSAANPLKDKRKQAVAFVIKDSAYVVTGVSNTETSTRMYVYDSKNDQWNERWQIKNATDGSFDDDYTTIARYGAVAFVINNKAYVATGSLSNTWEYDPISGYWTEKTAFDAASRQGAVGFSVKGRGYVALGLASSTQLDDTYEFNPTEENDTND